MKRWKDNFALVEDGEYLSSRLLNCLLAYSENDMYKLICESIQSIFQKEYILNMQLSSNFNTLRSVLEYEVNQALQETLFIPLSMDDCPGESGGSIIRMLIQRFKPPIKHMFGFRITKDMSYKRLIIVDDCIGSGDQLIEFWETSIISDGTLLREWCKKKNVKPYYVVLVGYDNSINEIEKRCKDINIVCTERLNEHHRIFGDESLFWSNSEEKEYYKNILAPLLSEQAINLKGHKGLDFSVVMHKTIPDWTIPLFHKSRDEWNQLVERKDSNV